MLSMANHPETGTCIVCVNAGARNIKTEENRRVFLRAVYYMLHASQYDLESMRSGFGFLIDFSLMGWHNVMTNKFEDQAANLYARSYPMRMESFVFMKLTPLTMALTKVFTRISLSNKLRRRVVLRYDKYDFLYTRPSVYPRCVLPDCWGGDFCSLDFCPTVLRRLEQRYQWSHSFRLPECDETAAIPEEQPFPQLADNLGTS